MSMSTDSPLNFSVKNQGEKQLVDQSGLATAGLVGLLAKMAETSQKRKCEAECEEHLKRRRKTSNDEAIDLSFKLSDSLEGSETSDSGNHSNVASGDEGIN